MKRIIVRSNGVLFDFSCEAVSEKDGIVELIENHQVIAQFKNWDCWYEKTKEEEKENRNTTK